MRFPGIVIGDTLTVARTVTDEDTAGNYWKTDVEKLLSTPGLVAMMIEASTRLVDEKLPEGFISVGKRAEVVHEHPTVIGTPVILRVEIKGFDGYHIRIKMTAYDGEELIGRGSHERSIVNKKWMLLKVNKRVTA